MKKKRSTKRKVLYGFMAVAFLVFLGMAFSNQIKYFLINQKTEAYAKEIDKIDYKKIKENEKKEATYDIEQVQAVSESALAEALMAKPTSDSNNAVGFISVPSVSIKMTIFQGLENSNLLYGAGTAKANQKMGEGNYVLASHKLQNPYLLFSPLENSEIGNKIYLTNKEKIFEYEIAEKMIVRPTRGDLMDDVDGKKMITLITCSDMQGTKRLIVQGELRNVWEYKKAPSNVTQVFTF